MSLKRYSRGGVGGVGAGAEVAAYDLYIKIIIGYHIYISHNKYLIPFQYDMYASIMITKVRAVASIKSVKESLLCCPAT